MRLTPDRDHPAAGSLRIALFFLALLFTAGLAAAQQDPTVAAADPDMAVQETYDLVVKVSGSNFGTDSQVDFLVTGTEDPGGITVKNVKRRNPKTLEVTIDVAPDAQFEKKFDIRVRTNGRTGKGTELFSVIERTTGGGGDTTPPGEVTDLALLEADWGSAVLGWTASSDDAGDASSGPPARYIVRLRTDGPLTLANWSDEISRSLEHWLTPFIVDPWPNPGEAATLRVVQLAPGSYYYVGLRAEDDAGNLSAIAHLEVETPETPISAWFEEVIGRDCPPGSASWLYPVDLEIDPDGEPALLYQERCDPMGLSIWLNLARRSQGVWSTQRLPIESSDPRFGDLAFDPATGEPVLAHTAAPGKLYFYRYAGGTWAGDLVERSQAGAVSLEYANGAPIIAYKRGATIQVAEKIGNRWEKSGFDLPKSQNTPFAFLDLALDGAGNPAVAYGEDRDGNASSEVIQVAIRNGSSWRIEWADAEDPSWGAGTPSLVWDPRRQNFSVAFNAGDSIQTCDRRDDGTWACVRLPLPSDWYLNLEASSLVVDASGGFHLFFSLDASIAMVATRPADASEWTAPEFVVANVGSIRARLDPGTGAPQLAVSALGLEPGLPVELRFAWTLP